MNKHTYKLNSFPDGAVCVEAGIGGMEVDLVFAEGYTTGDPKLFDQQDKAKFIVKACNNFDQMREALVGAHKFFEQFTDMDEVDQFHNRKSRDAELNNIRRVLDAS